MKSVSVLLVLAVMGGCATQPDTLTVTDLTGKTLEVALPDKERLDAAQVSSTEAAVVTDKEFAQLEGLVGDSSSPLSEQDGEWFINPDYVYRTLADGSHIVMTGETLELVELENRELLKLKNVSRLFVQEKPLVDGGYSLNSLKTISSDQILLALAQWMRPGGEDPSAEGPGQWVELETTGLIYTPIPGGGFLAAMKEHSKWPKVDELVVRGPATESGIPEKDARVLREAGYPLEEMTEYVFGRELKARLMTYHVWGGIDGLGIRPTVESKVLHSDTDLHLFVLNYGERKLLVLQTERGPEAYEEARRYPVGPVPGFYLFGGPGGPEVDGVPAKAPTEEIQPPQ